MLIRLLDRWVWGLEEKLVLEILIWKLLVYVWYLKVSISDGKSNGVFGNGKEVVVWYRIIVYRGLRFW